MITAQKDINQKFEQFEFIVNASQDLITLIRKDYTYISANRAFCSAHNKCPGDIVGKKVSQLWGKTRFNKFIKSNLDKCFSGNTVYYKSWFEFGSLGRRYMEVNYFPYKDDNNKITHCAVVSHDITKLKINEIQLNRINEGLEVRVKKRTIELEKLNNSLKEEILNNKQAELNIRNAHLEIKQLLKSIRSIIIALSFDKKITHFNETAEKIFLLSSKDVLNIKLKNLKIAWDWELINTGINKCIQKKEPVKLKNILLKNNQKNKRILELNVNPIFDENKKLTGLLLWGTDVTERKNLEVQLSQAQKLEAIGQLAAGIAHEINTPTQYIGDNTRFLKVSFNSINKFIKETLDLLRMNNKTERENNIKKLNYELDIDYLIEEIPKAIDETLMGVERVTKIVNSMKEFSHPGLEEKTSVDLNKAIESTITISKNEWKYVAEMKTYLDKSLPMVSCIPDEFNQAILNLIVNAAHAIEDVIKLYPERKGIITVSTRQKEDFIEIRVADNGTGIPEEIKTKIFDPFFTKKEVGKGTGQGLFISHAVIAEKLKGKLFFETEKDKGTVFIIQLPR